jgi:hypothetical protein
MAARQKAIKCREIACSNIQALLKLLSVAERINPAPRQGIQVRGRPVLGVYSLRCMLPANVLQELMRVENETEVYRTRIAANVLCEWAKQQQANRLHG